MADDGIDVALTELLEQAIEAMLQRVGGPLFGRVDTYTPATGRAAIVPLVPLWVDGEIVTPPKLHSVPVAWPGGMLARIHMPIHENDVVMLLPLGHDHSAWLTTATPNVPPPSRRRMSLADLVAVPIYVTPAAIPIDSAGYHSAMAVLYGQWLVGSSAASKAVALHGDQAQAPTLSSMGVWMGQVETAINALAPGSVAPLSTTFSPAGIAQVSATAVKLKAE